MGCMRLKHPGGNVAATPLGVAHDERIPFGFFPRSHDLNVLAAQWMKFVMHEHAICVIPGIMWMVRPESANPSSVPLLRKRVAEAHG